MRNCIRDIFTYWRNVFGREQRIKDFPFEMVVKPSDLPLSYTVYNGYGHGALIFSRYIVVGGTEYMQSYGVAEGGSISASGLTPDVGSVFRLVRNSGYGGALEVNGVMIFDNR